MQSTLISQLETRGVELPPQEREQILSAAQDLLDSNIALHALQTGESAPDVTLLDTTGAPVRLHDTLRDGPAILTFFRGRWCSYCRKYLSELQAAADAIGRRGARILAVSPQTAAQSRATQAELDLAFPLFSDPGNAAAAAFGLAYTLPTGLRWAYEQLGIDLPAHNGESSFRLPVPATYTIAPDGRIRAARVDPDYTRRPSIDSLLSALARAGFERPALDPEFALS